MALDSMAASALWELSWLQQGTAEEWAQLERLMTVDDSRPVMLRAYRGELAAGVDCVNFARDTRQRDNLIFLLAGTTGIHGRRSTLPMRSPSPP